MQHGFLFLTATAAAGGECETSNAYWRRASIDVVFSVIVITLHAIHTYVELVSHWHDFVLACHTTVLLRYQSLIIGSRQASDPGSCRPSCADAAARVGTAASGDTCPDKDANARPSPIAARRLPRMRAGNCICSTVERR